MTEKAIMTLRPCGLSSRMRTFDFQPRRLFRGTRRTESSSPIQQTTCKSKTTIVFSDPPTGLPGHLRILVLKYGKGYRV